MTPETIAAEAEAAGTRTETIALSEYEALKAEFELELASIRGWWLVVAVVLLATGVVAGDLVHRFFG